MDKKPITRRVALKTIGGVTTAVAIGCSDGDDPNAGGASSSTSGNGSSNQAGTTVTSTSQAGSTTSSTSGTGGEGGTGPEECDDTGGLTPAELLGAIDTFVVLCMENRSFDHFLGSLKLIEGRDVDGLTGTETNPDPDGMPVPVHELDDFTVDSPPHGWDACHAQWDNGANDGFVTEHAGDTQNDVMGYHVRSQLPITYALADAYTVCDKWHASVMGPTWPNRFYLHGATSNGKKDNTPVLGGFTSIWDRLDDKGISNKNYYHDLPWATGGYLKFGGLSGIENFFEAAQAGDLPQFSILDPQFTGSGANDDHPDHDVHLGQALMAAVYAALAQSPQWGKCMLIITNDEHGGFFDHVSPPLAADPDPDFARLGFRVPSIVIGPFARKGCRVSTLFEHASILKSATIRFGLESLNQRMDTANDLSSTLSPAFLQNPQPPIQLPVLDFSLSAILARGDRGNHEEMREVFDSGLVPSHLDRRRNADAITERVLREAERLGVVRLRA